MEIEERPGLYIGPPDMCVTEHSRNGTFQNQAKINIYTHVPETRKASYNVLI